MKDKLNKFRFTWAIKWNVGDLPSEGLCCMDEWNLPIIFLLPLNGRVNTVFFPNKTACQKYVARYIKNVIRDNQEYSEHKLEAQYRIFELVER